MKDETLTNKRKNIALGCDHAGYSMKEDLKKFFQQEGFVVRDYGTDSAESVDYPDYVHPLAQAVEKKEQDLGILICGSGNGVAITANKHKGIRAALCWNKEIASLARHHNNANILCMPSRFIDLETAKEIAITFIYEQFDGGRHEARVKKIEAC